jgi:hypothetical protein
MDDCEKFLAEQLPWVRAALKGEESPKILSALARPGGIERLQKALDEYEELLKHCPKHLRDYRKRTADGAVSYLPSAESGRPASREVRELGREAAELFKQGHSYGEIAHKLCEHRGERGHRCGKQCADRMRQRAMRYMPRATT